MSSWIFVLSYLLVHSVSGIQSSPENEIISKYVPNEDFGYGRPILDPQNTITVNISFEVRDILELSTTTQRIKVRGYIRMKWQNEWLNWNAANEGNVSSIYLEPSMAWFPEVVSYTSNGNNLIAEGGSEADDDWTSKNIRTKLQIDSNGMTTWLSPIYLESSCYLELNKFPYDQQRCLLVLGAWSDTTATLKLKDMMLPVLKDGFRQNVEWELTAATSRVTDVYYKCCKEPISKYEVELHLRRKSKYYIFHYVAPVVFLVLILLMTNFVPLESSERFNLLLLICLTAAFMLLHIVKTILPNADEISTLSRLYVLLLFDIFVSIMTTTIVANFYFNSSKLVWFPKWIEKRILPKHLQRDEIIKVTENDALVQMTEFLNSPDTNEQLKRKEKSVLEHILGLLLEYNNNQYDEVKSERIEIRSRMLAAFLDKFFFCILLTFSAIIFLIVI